MRLLAGVETIEDVPEHLGPRKKFCELTDLVEDQTYNVYRANDGTQTLYRIECIPDSAHSVGRFTNRAGITKFFQNAGNLL